MADPGKWLTLGIILIIGMGISQANNANNCFEESNNEVISLAQSQNTIKAMNISNNQNLTFILSLINLVVFLFKLMLISLQ